MRFVDQRLEVDAVDEVERVEHVALRLRHLLAFLVAHDRVDVDVAKRHFAGEVGRRHDHPRDPEEDDVEAGDEHRRRQERLELPRLARASRASSGTTAPTRTRCRARPRRCVEAPRLAAELRARLRPRRGLVARDVDVARLVVPRRDPVAPPELARDAPVLDVVDPVQVGRQPLAGDERNAAGCAGLRARQAARRPRRGRGPGSCAPGRTDALPAPASSSPRTTGRSASARRPRRCARSAAPSSCAASRETRSPAAVEIGEHRLARDVAVEAAILRRRVVVDRRVEVEDRDRGRGRGAGRSASR